MRKVSGFVWALLLAGLSFHVAPTVAHAQQMPALPTGVRLVLARCDSIVDRKSLLEQLRIELLSIVKLTAFQPSLETSAFSVTASAQTWTSTPYVADPANAWTVYFSSGGTDGAARSTPLPVRCVR